MQNTAQDIISLPIELNDKIVDSKFRLVHVAAQRVRQLSAGEPAVVATRAIKEPTIALEEAVGGRLRVLLGEEAKKAREDFEKQREQAKIQEELSAKEEEIRKELSVYLQEAREEGVSVIGQEEAGEEGYEEAEPLGEDNIDEAAVEGSEGAEE